MNNMEIYDKSKACPSNALRTIQAGKLKGKSDINPVWRIKQLTELFGPCGVGWKLSNIRYWTEPGAGGEVSAWCSLNLHIKVDGEWSDGIEGIGGSMLINTEKGKLVTNDEAYKMAQTDAVSVACKMLGFAADVYWEADRTKYDGNTDPEPPTQPEHIYCECCGEEITTVKKKSGEDWLPKEQAIYSKLKWGAEMCFACQKERKKADDAKKEAELSGGMS